MFGGLPESFPECGDEFACSDFLSDAGTGLHGFKSHLEEAVQVVPLAGDGHAKAQGHDQQGHRGEERLVGHLVFLQGISE